MKETTSTSHCTRQNVLKGVVFTIVFLLGVQLCMNNVLSERYKSWGFYLNPRTLTSNSTNNSTQSYGYIRSFIESGQLRNVNRAHVKNTSVFIGTIRKIMPSQNSSNKNNKTDVQQACALIPPDLSESIQVDKTIRSYDEIKAFYPTVLPGGRWKPKDCTARNKIAIIIPFRNRDAHLKIFLMHMHRFLQKQLLDYGIFVIELAEPTKFNRAMLMNVGFTEALKLYDYQCFFFHDVDLLPEDERNLYSCPDQPRHMSAAIDTMNYKLPYNGIFGGVSALTKEQMIKVNGFSNKFFGWGAEDDDMHNRIVSKHYKIIRYPIAIARYKMLSHKKDKPSDRRMTLLYQGKKRFDTDGLNSLLYKCKSIELRPLYTWILVEIDEEAVMKALRESPW